MTVSFIVRFPARGRSVQKSLPTAGHVLIVNFAFPVI